MWYHCTPIETGKKFDLLAKMWSSENCTQWEHKSIQPLQQYLVKLKVCTLSKAATPLPVHGRTYTLHSFSFSHTHSMKPLQRVCTRRHHLRWPKKHRFQCRELEQQNCPLVEAWTHQPGHIHSTEHYIVVKSHCDGWLGKPDSPATVTLGTCLCCSSHQALHSPHLDKNTVRVTLGPFLA